MTQDRTISYWQVYIVIEYNEIIDEIYWVNVGSFVSGQRSDIFVSGHDRSHCTPIGSIGGIYLVRWLGPLVDVIPTVITWTGQHTGQISEAKIGIVWQIVAVCDTVSSSWKNPTKGPDTHVYRSTSKVWTTVGCSGVWAFYRSRHIFIGKPINLELVSISIS